MARKRATTNPPPASRHQQPRNDDLNHHHKSPRDISPDNKIDNLKTLNQLLLKETMEKRFQIDQLKAHIDEIEESQPFASDLEREVSRIVLASAMAEEAKKVESMQEMLGFVSKEKDDMEKELGGVVEERDSMREQDGLMRKEIGELEVKVRDLEGVNDEIRGKLGLAVAERDEIERLWRKKEEGFDALKEMMDDLENEREEMGIDHEEEVKGLRAEIEAKVARILALEEEGRHLVDANRRLELEMRDLKDDVGLLSRDRDGLRSKVIELEQKNVEAAGELGMVQADLLVLEKEKEAMEIEFESKVQALELKLVELSKGMGEILREKDEIATVRAEQEVELLGLKKEIEKLRLDVVELETMCAASGEKNARLVDEKALIAEEFAALEKEMGEKEKGYEAKVGELSMKLDDLSAKMRAISLEKDEIEKVRAKQEEEIVGLKKQLEMLSSNALELEETCRGYGEMTTQLQDDRDAVERELGVQREESGRLCLQVEELMKSRDECLKELKKLDASLGVLVSEKDEGKRRIESLAKEKASLERSLSAAKETSESSMKKVLSLLRSTAGAMNKDEVAQQNGIFDDEEMHPFAKEMESIKGAFKSRSAKIAEMNRELIVMQDEAENAKKKKLGLLMWLYPATTLLAAISVAFAVRGR